MKCNRFIDIQISLVSMITSGNQVYSYYIHVFYIKCFYNFHIYANFCTDFHDTHNAISQKYIYDLLYFHAGKNIEFLINIINVL